MSQMTSTARVAARALNRPVTTTPRLRVVTGAPLRRGDAAFGIICTLLLAAGLIGLLLLNTALAQGSFTLHDLQATSDQLTDAQAALNQSVEASRSPANLASRAVSMGMVPAQSVTFLRLSDGKVIGVAKPASPEPGYTVVRMTASAARVVAKPAKPAPAPVAAKPAKPAPAPVVAKPAKPAKPAPARVVARPAKPASAPAAKRPAKPATR